MSLNRCIVLTGSNIKPYSNVSKALQELKKIDSTLQSLPEELTPSLGNPNRNFYLNQLHLLQTALTAEELTIQFKSLEKLLGRKSEDKEKGIVHIDIDLVYFNNQLLKPKEATLPYVQEGLKKLDFNIFPMQ
ncbi:MAG: 2-amino-4-hydroxy-6-hydroxymethyldihydropteridine diphosphokinase [Bacteroidales bacterium]|nr:2-amino-4-hydroxy-6-hydroxymethyldihydropteridine diphosphokinase [Bacteroidales bacterium]